MLRSIVENTANGKIDKKIAAQLIKLVKSEMQAEQDVAIIGMAANLPCGISLEEFWQVVESGVDCISSFPNERKKDINNYLDYISIDDEERKYFEGAYINAIDNFDFGFFKISPQEAKLMDPYQRLFLQTAYHALEDAGYGNKKIQGTKTGVFVGYASNIKDSYQKMIYDTSKEDMAAAAVGNVTAMLPSRLSYLLDLRGPSMVMDSACSSGLLSIHQACKALKNADCEMVLAGSVRVNMIPLDREYMRFGIEASDGRTRSFDDMSDGSGMGEGIIMFLLKPIDKAIKDNDHIYGVIKGSAVNQDGTSIGITAPNPAAQTDVVLEAWNNAGIRPQQLSYIETHGTGTPLGDPIEMEGLEKAFRMHSAGIQVCPIGTIKTITGHLYESAGTAGLLKVLLMMKHKKIPPNIFFNVPNSKINFIDSPFYLNTKLRGHNSDPMVCGISSFGFSGTNCHMIVSEYMKETNPVVDLKPMIFTLSAHSKELLEQYIETYQSYLETDMEANQLSNICYTLSARREHYYYRIALICSTLKQLKEQLNQLSILGLASDNHKGIYYGTHKIVPATKKNKEPNELTSGDIRGMCAEVSKLLKEYSEETESSIKLFHRIAMLYSLGAAVSWEELYKDIPVRNIPMPLYPFERKRCWITIPEREKNEAKRIDEYNTFTTCWVKESLKKTGNEKYDFEGVTVIFRNQNDQLKEIVDQYRENGQTCIEVYHGSSFKELDFLHYISRPTEEDYICLFEKVSPYSIGRIIHGITLANEIIEEGTKSLEEHLQEGVYSLFCMTKALKQIGLRNTIDMVILTSGSAWVDGYWNLVRPENAPIVGIGKVIKKEHPELDCRCIDIDSCTQMSKILQEVHTLPQYYHVAYRDNIRYVQAFTELDMDSISHRNIHIKETGVYLITGGLGGIGLEVAKYLAKEGKVNLAMINRTSIPTKDKWDEILASSNNDNLKTKINKLLELQALGADVTCYHADVSNYERMKAVIKDVRSKYYHINGVIHGAGVGGAEQISTRSFNSFKEVFDPKVLGTWNLHSLTLEDNLDIFISFSSIASLFSAPGQADYIAGNSYLDSFSYYRNSMGLPSVTLNWSTWKETGMSIEHDFTVDTIFKMLTTKDGIGGFAKAINKQVPQVVIGQLNLESKVISLLNRFQLKLSEGIDKELTKRLGNTKVPDGNRKQKITQVKLTGKIEGYTELEKALGSIWGKVLGFESLDVYDNFYDLGGDSILGLRIANLIHEELNISVNPADMIKYLTIDEVCEHLSTLKEGTQTTKIERIEDQEYYETSSAQKRIYSQYLIEKDSTAYNLSKALFVEGVLNVERLNYAFSQIVERHENLRSTFHLTDEGLMQKVQQPKPMFCTHIAWNNNDMDEIINDFVKPFELSQEPLMRLGYCPINDGKGLLLLDIHHIITDGISMDILITELLSLYRGTKLEPLSIQYRDFAYWQNGLKDTEIMEQHKQFWLDLLKAPLQLLHLPTDYIAKENVCFTGATIRFDIDELFTDQLKEQAKVLNVSLYMVMLSGFLILLHKYSAQEDIVIGTPTAGRPNKDTEQLIGMFVNTLVLRHQVPKDIKLKELIVQVKDQCLKCFKHQDFQFEDVVKALKIPRENNYHPLFNVMFVFQNVGNTRIEMEGMNFEVYPFNNSIAKFDLTFEVVPDDKGLRIGLNYLTGLYHEQTAERMMTDYVYILKAMCIDFEAKVGDVKLPSLDIFEPAVTEDIEISFNF